MQTLVELQPTDSSQVTSRKSTTPCFTQIHGILPLFAWKPPVAGANPALQAWRKVGQASACHTPARHKMCATAGKRRKKVREPEITVGQVFQEALAALGAVALSTAASLLKRKTGSGMVK